MGLLEVVSTAFVASEACNHLERMVAVEVVPSAFVAYILVQLVHRELVVALASLQAVVEQLLAWAY